MAYETRDNPEVNHGSLSDDPSAGEASEPEASAGSTTRVCVAKLPDGSLWVYEEPFSPPPMEQIPPDELHQGNEDALRALWTKLKAIPDDGTSEANFQAGAKANGLEGE
jgi:hypothetical protein